MENISSEQEIPAQKSNFLSSSISKSYPILKSSTPRTLDKIASGPVNFKDSVVIKDKNTPTPEPLQERLIAPKENFEIPDLGSLESINSNSSKSVYLSVLLNILFIASFLLEFQTGSANRMNLAIQKEIDGFPYSTEPMLYLSDATTMSDVSFFLNNVILGNVLDPDRVYTPTNYKNTLNQSLDSTWISSESSSQTQNPDVTPSEDDPGSGTGTGMSSGSSSSTTTANTTQASGQNNETTAAGDNTETTTGPPNPPPFLRVLRNNEQSGTRGNYIGILAEEDEVDENQDEILRILQSSTSTSTTTHYFLNSFNLFKGMLITYYYNDQSPYQGIKFTLFYEATISSSNAYNQSRKLLKGLQNGYIKSVNIEIEFLNVIKQIGVYYQYSFQQDDQAEFQMSTDAQPFYPKTFDKDFYDSTSRTLIILFRVLFALSLLVQLVKVFAVDIYKAFKTLFQTHKLHLPLDVIYDIGLVVLLIIVLILSVDQTFRQRGTCTLLETIDQEKFQLFKSFANFQRFFVRLLSATIAFLIIQILLLLNTQFPTFGILFYTLGQSKNKLATYGILILTLMAGFVALMTLNFGQGDVSMNAFGKSLFLVFQYMVGGAEYKQLKAANDKLAGLYFLVFYIIFNLLIVLLFIAIIMATYAQLRKKLQITTLALAELMGEKSKKLKEKYLNLILFRPPKQDTLDEESLKRRRLSVHQIQQLKNQQEHKKKNLLSILLHNLEELDWFGCTNNHHMTRDEIENQVKEKIIEIRKRQIQKEQDKINERKTSVFGKLMNLLVHLIFIIVYTYTLNYELKRPQSFEINQAIGDYFLKSVFFSDNVQVNKTFSDITTVEDIIQWTREVYFNGIFEGFTDSDDSTTISSVYSQNNIISSAVSRINFRNLQMRRSNEVEDSTTSFYIRSPNDISPSDKHSSSEVQDEIVFPEMTVDYTPSGTLATFRQEGGYYWTFPRNKTLAQDYMNKIQHPKLLNINTGLMTLQTVYLNGNYELLGLCEFIISIKASGYIQKDYKTHVFQVNLSSCQDCRAKIVLEIIYILFVLKQIYELVQQFREEWNKKESKKLTPINKKFINRSWIIQVLNHDVEKSKFLPTLWAVLVRLWQLCNRFITTTLNFWKKTYANLILTISIILTLCCFYYYLKILLQGFRKEVDLAARPSDSTDSLYGANEIGNYEELATLTNSYATLQAFNSWLIILRLLFEFGFSRELSFILDLIYGSLFDILFFSLTFLIIIFGFAIDGFLMFGPEAEGFKDLGSAFLQILIWIISGRITDETVNEKVDSGTKAVFFIFLIVICLLILLKMFMAILDSQFMSLASSEFEAEHLGFFELIVHIIGEKVREKKIQLKVVPTPSNAGTLNKMRIRFMNKFYKTRYVILTKLKKTILQDEDNTLSEEEFKKREQAAEDNKVAVHLDFHHYGGGKEQREIELEDLQFYLRDTNQPELVRGLSSVQNPETVMTEDPFLNPAKWMNYLEENIQKVTNEKIKLAKYGSRAQDYVSLERKINPEIEKRLQNILDEVTKQYPDETITAQFFAENIAIPEYKKASKDKQNSNIYSTISDHINFIYYQVLNQFGDAFSAAQANIDTPIESPFGQKHLKKKMMRLDHHIYREEYFNINDLTLLNFWETLKIKHQYQLWAGDHRDLLSDDIRGCLWKLMKFDGALFTTFIDQKIFKSKGLSSKAIGLLEIHWIWHSLACTPKTTSPRENLSDSEDIPNSNVDELSIKHMNLAENLLRGDDENLIVKLRKNNTLKGKLNYLSSLKRVKNDKKLMLWLLTPLDKKTDIILRIQDPVLLRFTFFLLLEEVYDNSHLIHTVETGLNQEIKNKIYMFFFFFSQFEALQHSMKTQKFLGSREQNSATIEYIQFLEKQVESTNNVKRQYLRDINLILQKEKELKQQEDFVFSREDSGIPSSQQSFSPEKSRLTENPLFLREDSGASSPQKGFSPERPIFRENLAFLGEESGSASPQKSNYSPEKSRFTENEEKENFLRKSFLIPQRTEVKENEGEEFKEDNSPSHELAVLPDELEMHFESSSSEDSSGEGEQQQPVEKENSSEKSD